MFRWLIDSVLWATALPFKKGGGGGGSDEIRRQEEERQARIRSATASVNNNFAGFDDNYYGGVADAYKQFYLPMLEEQYAESKRKLPFGYSSTTGSAYARDLGMMERDYQRALADIGSQALQYSDEQRSNIERNRSDLLNMASAGSDADVVAGQAARQAQSLAAPPKFSPVADLFARYSALAANQALGRTAATGTNDPGAGAQTIRPLLFSSPSSSSTRVVG